jgi:hypothetical protein
MYRPYTAAAGETLGVKTSLSLLSSFFPAPLAYVNLLTKVLFAREAYDMGITINRMIRQLDEDTIKNPGGGKE